MKRPKRWRRPVRLLCPFQEGASVVSVIVVPIFQKKAKLKYGVIFESKGGKPKFGFPCGGIDNEDFGDGARSSIILRCGKRELQEEMFGGKTETSLYLEKGQWKIVGMLPAVSIVSIDDFDNQSQKRWVVVVEVFFAPEISQELIPRLAPGPEQEKVLLFSSEELLANRHKFFSNHCRVIDEVVI